MCVAVHGQGSPAVWVVRGERDPLGPVTTVCGTVSVRCPRGRWRTAVASGQLRWPACSRSGTSKAAAVLCRRRRHPWAGTAKLRDEGRADSYVFALLARGPAELRPVAVPADPSDSAALSDRRGLWLLELDYVPVRIRKVEIPNTPWLVPYRLSDRHGAPHELGKDLVHIVNREAHRHLSGGRIEPTFLVEHQPGSRKLRHGITREPHLQTEFVPVEGHRPPKLRHWQVHMTQSHHDHPSCRQARHPLPKLPSGSRLRRLTAIVPAAKVTSALCPGTTLQSPAHPRVGS